MVKKIDFSFVIYLVSSIYVENKEAFWKLIAMLLKMKIRMQCKEHMAMPLS